MSETNTNFKNDSNTDMELVSQLLAEQSTGNTDHTEHNKESTSPLENNAERDAERDVSSSSC